MMIREEYVPSSDGTRIYTIAVLPGTEGAGKYPVVLMRNPYVGADSGPEQAIGDSRGLTDRGYALVYQHCRGTGKSEGEFIPYRNERADGLAALDWIRAQDFFGGEIYLFGGSYLSSVHWSYLDVCPKDVRGAVLEIQDCDQYVLNYRGGVFKTGLCGWFEDMYRKRSLGPSKRFDDSTFSKVRMTEFSQAVFGEKVGYFEHTLRHPDPDDLFWLSAESGAGYRAALARVNFPLLFVTGQYDIYTAGMYRMWREMPAPVRAVSAMIVTPYDHGKRFREGDPATPVSFPGGEFDKEYPEYPADWFDHIRSGRQLKFAETGKVKYYALFGGGWEDADISPRGKGLARLYFGDHTLGASPQWKGEIGYSYDPSLTPSHDCGVNENFGGMKRQPEPQDCKDSVCFVSEPYGEHVKVRGPVYTHLTVRSDREDTVFYVRIDIVRPDGTYPLRDGIAPLKFRRENYVSGEEVSIDFVSAPAAFDILPGDRLRVDVASGCQGYLAHTNRDGLQTDIAPSSALTARNTVVCGDRSYITMEIV